MIGSPDRSTLVVLGLVAILAVGTGSVVAQQQEIRADGRPNIDVFVPDNTFMPGSDAELTLQLNNDGKLTDGQETDRELVTTARSVVVDVDAEDAPIEVSSEARSVGTLSETEPQETTFGIEVPDTAEPGTYEIDVEVDYSYTSRVRQLPATTDETQESNSVTRTVEIEIDDAARFRVTNVSSNLRVDETGEITGEVVNVGEQDATNAEIQFPTESENVFPLETAVAVGDVPAGESAEFRIPVEVGSEAEAVPKLFDLPVSFRNENGIRTTDDSPEFLATIDSERDEFIVEATDSSIAAGETRTIEFTVTNNRDETLTAIEPKLFTDTPFSSDDDEAFIQSLDPGESETIRFELTAAGSATQKTHPVTVDFRYDDAEGSSRISKSYRAAIDVTEAEDGGGLGSLGGIVIGLLSLVAIGGGYVWYRGQ